MDALSSSVATKQDIGELHQHLNSVHDLLHTHISTSTLLGIDLMYPEILMNCGGTSRSLADELEHVSNLSGSGLSASDGWSELDNGINPCPSLPPRSSMPPGDLAALSRSIFPDETQALIGHTLELTGSAELDIGSSISSSTHEPLEPIDIDTHIFDHDGQPIAGTEESEPPFHAIEMAPQPKGPILRPRGISFVFVVAGCLYTTIHRICWNFRRTHILICCCATLLCFASGRFFAVCSTHWNMSTILVWARQDHLIFMENQGVVHAKYSGAYQDF